MAFVTDPDDLDRYQVCFDSTNSKISIRGLGAVRQAKRTDGASAGATGVFTSAGALFQTNSVAAGDILIVLGKTTADSAKIGHYTVSTVDSETQITVTPSFAAGSETGLTFRVQDEVSAAGPSGGKVGDGVTLQALYSFAKEEWKTAFDANAPDLIKFIFPFESITREQFELGGTNHGNWDFTDATTRNLIRTGGWKLINSSGVTQKEYTGVVTLGALDSDAQVYYLQTTPATTPSNFVLTGAVNQAILTFTDGGDDNRGALTLFVRKRGRSYAQSAIADIGVSTIETIVNRFPLTHSADPAILAANTDGKLAGAAPWQNTFNLNTNTDAVTVNVDGSTGTITSASSTWNSGANQLYPGDTIEITVGDDLGYWEVITVDSATQVTVDTKGRTFVGDTAQTFQARTRVLIAGTDGATADVDGATGTLTSAGSDFASAGRTQVNAGDMLLITAGNGPLLGVYKVVSRDSATQLTINTSDQIFTTQASQTFRVLEPGMHLQYRETLATQIVASGGRTLTFNNANPDTITASSGNFATDGYKAGMMLTVTGTTSNNGTFIIDTVAATTLTLIAEETLTAEGPLSATATLNGKTGFVRSLKGDDFPFHWRLFGRSGTLAECFQWIQKELRRATDIDVASTSARGDITALLMTFASPNGVTTDLFIDDVAAADKNNITQKDMSGDSRNYAFISSISITISDTLIDDAAVKIQVYWEDAPNQWGTAGAVLVQDDALADMEVTNPSASPVTFSYDYDATQNGHGGGVDQDIVIVAIGFSTAQYVKTRGTISRQNTNPFSLSAALERNASNP